MRNIRKRAVSVLAVAAVFVFTVFLCGACERGNAQSTRYVTCYVSTDSRAFSTTADVVQSVADAVVEIQTETQRTQWGMQYVVSGAGSGVIIGHEDFTKYFIITNNHVIEGASTINVKLRSAAESMRATLVATDVQGDIAVISINTSSTLNIAVWGNSDTLCIGEDVIAIGNPLGNLGGTVTKGIISAKARQIPVGNYTMTLLQTDTAINPGNSGGGLFNMNGELIGVVNAKTTDEEVEGICFAIPANTARKIADDLLANGVVTGRVTFGIKVTLGNGSKLYVTDDSGVTDPNTFQKYDLITEINGNAISSMLSYNDALAGIAPDESVTVKVRRGKATVTMFGVEVASESTDTEFTIVARQTQRA